MAGLGVGGIGGMPGMRGDNANVDPEAMLNTCIHNYFISKEKPHIAKAIRDGGLNIEHGKLKMENKTQMNGADAGDADSKDDKSRLGSLDASDNFLLDYWFIFWDMWKASKEKADPNTAASQYLQMTQVSRTGVDSMRDDVLTSTESAADAPEQSCPAWSYEQFRTNACESEHLQPAATGPTKHNVRYDLAIVCTKLTRTA